MDYNTAILDAKKEFQDPDRLAEEKEVIKNYGQMFHPDNLDIITVQDSLI